MYKDDSKIKREQLQRVIQLQLAHQGHPIRGSDTNLHAALYGPLKRPLLQLASTEDTRFTVSLLVLKRLTHRLLPAKSPHHSHFSDSDPFVSYN
ncbi:MAG: hypothetical protein ACFFB2_20975 [Promethearchaeota archaeon]